MNRLIIFGLLLLAIMLLPKYVGAKVTALSQKTNAAGSLLQVQEPVLDSTGNVMESASSEPVAPAPVQWQAAPAANSFSGVNHQLRYRLGTLQDGIQKYRVLILILNLIYYILILIGVAVLVVAARFTLAKRLCESGFRLGTGELLLICLLTVLAHFCGLNFYAGVHFLFWLTPACCLLFCAYLLRLLDPNYPVWNAALCAIGLPILSATLVLGMDPFLARFRQF